MKRVLLVAYAFPPEPLPGALRPGYAARYLPNFGWDVTVLTHTYGEPPFPARVVRVGARPPAAAVPARTARRDSALRNILRTVRDLAVFPDELAGWIAPAVARGLQLLRTERYDAILTTALPTSVHAVGACLSKLTRTPWVADYRDAWSDNPYMPWGPVKRRLQRTAERLITGRAARITTVSEPIARQLRALHGGAVDVIENAYDEAEWAAVPQESPSGFDLTYTGTMYAGKRSAEQLFAALADLRERRHPAADAARVHFYGHNNESVLQEAQRFGVAEQVHLHGVVPRAQAMRAQRRSAGVLIFLNTDPATAGERGSKYLEYLGARRRMLVFGPEASVMRETVEQCGLGWFCSDSAGASAALAQLYARFVAGDFTMEPTGRTAPSSIELARMFARCLDRAARTPRSAVRRRLEEPASS